MTKKKKIIQPVAILRDGIEIKVGDEVETDIHKSCEGLIFIVETITQWKHCESKSMVVVHLKGHSERKMLGFQKEGLDLGPLGIDANNFRKI